MVGIFRHFLLTNWQLFESIRLFSKSCKNNCNFVTAVTALRNLKKLKQQNKFRQAEKLHNDSEIQNVSSSLLDQH